MFKRIITAGLAVGMLGTAPSALAANCAMRDTVVDRLQSKYSEELTAGGFQGTNQVMAMLEVWSSPKTGTFTVMLTNPAGVTCIVATGTDWFQQTPEKVVPGRPS